MRVSRLLAVPALLTLAAGGRAQSPALSASRLLALIPGSAQELVYCRDFRRLEARWAKVQGPFGGKDRFLKLKHQTGIDPALVGSGPLARVTFRAAGAPETWAWLVPARDPRQILKGLRTIQKGGVWTWEAPVGPLKPKSRRPAPATLAGTMTGGYLIIASSEADLAAFRSPVQTLSAELAPYAAWLEAHDLSLVATTAAVREAAGSAGASFKPKPAEPGSDLATASPSKVKTRLQGKFERWAELARTSVHHVLGGLDLSEDGGLAFEVRALLTQDSALNRELAALPPLAGHPMRGLGAAEFALAFGGEWGLLSDFQAAVLEDLDKKGKAQPATRARLEAAMAAQNGLVGSMAMAFSAPAPRASLMTGLAVLVRVSDSQAYLAAMETTSQAQKAFFQELGLPDAVTFTRDLLPGVPSCGVATRLGGADDPSTASVRTAMTLFLGGDSLVMSMGALDGHQVLMVMGGPDLLKARLEEVRRAGGGLAPSIQAVEPDLGRDARFALYLDPRGMRNMAQVLAGMFGRPEGAVLPEIPVVPAAGLTLSLGPAAVEVRGSVRAETLRAAATLFQALAALMPDRQPGGQNPGH